MKYIVIILPLFFSSFSNAVLFSDYILDAYEASDIIKAAEYDKLAQEERYQSSKNYYIPKVVGASKYDYEILEGDESDLNESKITVSSTIANSVTKGTIDVANANVVISDIKLKIEKNTITRNILNNVYTIREYSKLMDVANDLKAYSDKFEKRITKEIELGISSQSDLKQADLLINKIDSEISNIRKQISLSVSNIELSSGLEYPVDGINLDDQVNEYISSYNFNGDHEAGLEYKLSIYEAELAKAAVKANDSLYLVNIETGIKNTLDKPFFGETVVNNEFFASLNISINMFDMDRYHENKALAFLQKAKESARNKARVDIMQNVNVTLSLDENFRLEIDNLTEQVKSIRSIVKLHEKEYNIGSVTLYEMINTQFDFLTTRKRLAEVSIEYYNNKVNLMTMVNQLSFDVHE
ncbi:TolC family protein [Vibrio crassostreae]|uniref:TolC family protein n=1 Tax=Vibrio crassostreae TaxID=246167 RepID=UPI002E196254|nr:TolC family protein [Vibrio crassostreae]